MVKPLLDTEQIVNTFLDTKNIKPRYERKFRIKINNTAFVRGYLEQLGFFQEFPQRIIKTLYFDTVNFKFAIDNINGLRYRIKPRLRWYEDLSSKRTSKTHLEYKIKDGFIGYKFSSEAMLSQVPFMIENRLGIKSSPTVTTSYNRIYLKDVYGIRATIDFNLRSNSFNDPLNKLHNLEYEINLDKFFRQKLFTRINEHSLFRLNKSSKYVEGLLACQVEL